MVNLVFFLENRPNWRLFENLIENTYLNAIYFYFEHFFIISFPRQNALTQAIGRRNYLGPAPGIFDAEKICFILPFSG